MNNPLVSIIIVNWNGKKYIDECITSLLNQTYNNHEIIIVDNASTDDSIEFVRKKFPTVKIIQNYKNLGFARGSNIGINQAKGDLIALFNQDAIADNNWLSLLVEEINKSDKIAGVAGKVYYYNDNCMNKKIDNIFCTWSKIDPYTALAYNFNGNEPKAKVDYITGCSMLVKKKIIDEIGLLDTGYFLYFDETDWCARSIRAGYDLLYIPSANVWHVVSGSIGESKLKLYYMTRNRIRFAFKNFDFKYIFLPLIVFFIETIFIFLKDLKELDFTDTKIRVKALYWNILNLSNTFKTRKIDFRKIKKNVSYNKSLPLRKYKIGRFERFFDKII